MKKTVLIINFLLSTMASAVHYNDFEIRKQLNQNELKQLSTKYLRSYFSSSQPESVIQDLIKSDLTPLELEYIFHQILTEISQQPPQDFHQKFIDLMKSYPSQATKIAEEGHLPVAIFNLSSQAYGLENIRTAFRTEMRLNQILNNDLDKALSEIKHILTLDRSDRRPQWLGVKNSLASLPEKSLQQISNHLYNHIQLNSGLDKLISHVGLLNADIKLIEKALSSKQTQIRELTLRQLPQYLTTTTAQTLLLKNAQFGLDRKFSVSLLSQFTQEPHVEKILIEQLSDKITAANAAFALSQSKSKNLPVSLKNHYFKSNDPIEKKHILFALKLNQSNDAKMTLNDLLPLLEPNSPEAKWIRSFEANSSGVLQ